jgi:hypothetical protein
MTFDTTKSVVLIADFDNGKDRTEERIAALARARGLRADVALRYLSMPNPWLDASNEAQMQALENLIRKLGAKLLIVDNLCVVSGKVEENSAEMGTVMANWRRLAENLRIAIVIIHHQTKGNNPVARAGNSLRGHSSIEASLDLALQVERDGQSNNVKINPTKVRGAEVPTFSALFTYEHMQGADILEEARFFGYETMDVSGEGSLEKIILDVLREHIEAYGPPNKNALAVKVQEVVDSKSSRKAPVGRNRIRDTIEVMVSEGKLCCSKGKGTEKLFSLPSGR